MKLDTRPLLDIHGITGGSYKHILGIAQAVERMGFNGFWGSDHQMGTAGVSLYMPVMDHWTILAALGAQTERIRLGVLVTGNTYRHPSILAKMAATVDVISNGRVELGIGAGWQEPEHRAFGIPFPTLKERLARLDDAVTMFKLLCTQHESTFQGNHYALERAPFEPKTIQKPYPPILMGGSGPGILRLAAKHATEWNGMGSPTYLVQRMKVLDERCAEFGRDPSTLRRSALVLVRLFDTNAEGERFMKEEVERLKVSGAERRSGRVWWVAEGETLDEALRGSTLAGTAREVTKRMETFAGLGLYRLMVGSAGAAWDIPMLERVAREIAPAFRRAV